MQESYSEIIYKALDDGCIGTIVGSTTTVALVLKPLVRAKLIDIAVIHSSTIGNIINAYIDGYFEILEPNMSTLVNDYVEVCKSIEILLSFYCINFPPKVIASLKLKYSWVTQRVTTYNKLEALRITYHD
jgi:hypothetical protein